MNINSSIGKTILKFFPWCMGTALMTTVLVYVLTSAIRTAVVVGIFDLAVKTGLVLMYGRKNKDGKKKNMDTFKPFVLWFTGLPSSGKTTVAGEVYRFLKAKKVKVERFDGDAIRSIFPSTGFDREERNNHIKRIGYLASLLEKNGVIVICSFVSPYEESRKFVRELCRNFIEVYISTSVETCETRDDKGLYKKARSGELQNFTGVNDPYEIPVEPQINIDTGNMSIEESFFLVKKAIEKYFN